MPWRCSRVASSRAAAWVDSGVSAGSTAYTRSLHVLRERARVLAGDRRHHVARPVGGQLGAQHDRAAREVAAEPARAAHDLHRVHVGPRAQLLQERAAQVLLDLLARLLDGHLGEAGHRREVEELERLLVGARRAAARARSSRHPRRSGPRRRCPEAPTPGGRARGRRRSGAARRRRPGRPATAPPGPAAGSRSRRASPPPPRPARPRGRVRRRTAPRRPSSDGRRGAARRGAAAPAAAIGLGRTHLAHAHAFACAAKSGWACSVSSPDSPVRIR